MNSNFQSEKGVSYIKELFDMATAPEIKNYICFMHIKNDAKLAALPGPHLPQDEL